MTARCPDAGHDHTAVAPSTLDELGALIGDPVRASLLLRLSDGSRRPAGELARLAGASPQAASLHLARLVDGGLLRVERQGRHRFYAIADGGTAETIESLANWLDQSRRAVRHPPALREARLCYDHLAGRLGVAILDRMTAAGFFTFGADGPRLSGEGLDWFARHGVTVAAPRPSRRPLLRLCCDWTERRNHMGGWLGAALTRKLMDGGFVAAGPCRRSLRVTARGADFFGHELAFDAALLSHVQA